MDLAGRHTSLHPNSATPLSPAPLNYSASTSMQMVSYWGKTCHRFHLVVMCADAWDLHRLVGCDIWYGWWDGACCLLSDPSSPSRRSSIRPEPLEADLSERCTQVVPLSSSSLATAASAGLFHCNAQLLSYRDRQNYTWLIWSRGSQTGIIQKVDQ